MPVLTLNSPVKKATSPAVMGDRIGSGVETHAGFSSVL